MKKSSDKKDLVVYNLEKKKGVYNLELNKKFHSLKMG